MADTTYDVGDIAVLQATFRDSNSLPINQIANVTAVVRKPDGTTENYTEGVDLTNPSTGVYRVAQQIDDQPGEWAYKFIGDDDVAQGTFYVEHDATTSTGLQPNALTTVPKARLHVFRDVTQTSNDEALVLYINWASDAIQNYTKREFVPQDNVDRIFDWDGSSYIDLAPYELRTLTDISYESDSTQVTVATRNYRLEPRGGTRQATFLSLHLAPAPIPPLYDFGYQLTITGDWGMSAIPADVEGACLLMVADLWRNAGGWQFSGSGGLQVQEPLAMMPVGGVPPAARRLLQPYLLGRTLGYVQFSRPLEGGYQPWRV